MESVKLMQELTDLDQSIKQLSDSYQAFLHAFKIQIERIDEMERMLENLRRERGFENGINLFTGGERYLF